MAEHLSPIARQIVVYLWSHPASWSTCNSLAEQTTHSSSEVEAAVRQLTAAGLITPFGTGRGIVLALTNSREAREQAMVLSHQYGVVEGSPDCRHHWMLEAPDGDLTRGSCKLCGAEKYFLSASSSAYPSRGIDLTRRGMPGQPFN